ASGSSLFCEYFPRGQQVFLLYPTTQHVDFLKVENTGNCWQSLAIDGKPMIAFIYIYLFFNH
ncbi:hypothetical protein, partial [Klebsiella pneumoniae]|uniref:hypothetical protein n=1 Tax=Klebsiella pneumoniae TaxID=573 RepID=UPI001D0D829D